MYVCVYIYTYTYIDTYGHEQIQFRNSVYIYTYICKYI